MNTWLNSVASKFSGARRDAVVALPIFTVGTASLFVLDLFLASVLKHDAVGLADWAFLKSVVLITSALALLGIDQSIIRTPIPAARLLAPLILQAAILCAPVLLLPRLITVSFSGVSVFLSCLCLTVLTGICGMFRSQTQISWSQVVLQSWRVLLSIAVLMSWSLYGGFASLSWMMTISLIASTLAAAMLSLYLDRSSLANSIPANSSPTESNLEESSPENTSSVNASTYVSLIPLGFRFWFFAILANATSYLDQVLLNLDGERETSSQFFKYTSLFLPVSLFFTGYLANVLSPYMRNHSQEFQRRLRYWLTAYFATGIGITVASLITGLAGGWILGHFRDGVNWTLAILIMAAATLRFVYLLPSAFLGVFGTRRELDAMLIASGISIVTMIAVYLGIRSLGGDALWAISLATLVNLVIRDAYGLWLVRTILQSSRELSHTP